MIILAYIKYKELTKYFNFNKEEDVENMPSYIPEFVEDDNIIVVYKNKRDYMVFTDKKIILFDKNPLATYKKIHIIPYCSISTSAIAFDKTRASIYFSLDSGYQMKLTFLNQNHDTKEKLKKSYRFMMNKKITLTTM